jgi:hypothetical protein
MDNDAPEYQASDDYVFVAWEGKEVKEEGVRQAASGLFIPAGAEDPDVDRKQAIMEENMGRGRIVSAGPNSVDTLYDKALGPDDRCPSGWTPEAHYVGDLVLFGTSRAAPVGNGLWLLRAKDIIARIHG